jgi:hypothetical protein
MENFKGIETLLKIKLYQRDLNVFKSAAWFTFGYNKM